MSIGGEEYGERSRAGEGDSAYDDAPSRLTTRTRLPDGEGGNSRPPARPGRSLVTVVGVIVLLIAAIAFANRGGGDGSGSGDTGDDKPGPNAQPTAPTGEHPVKDSQSGIAAHFPHTKQGAESAGANYAVALGGSGMFNKDSRHEIVKSVYTKATSEQLTGDQDEAYSADLLKRLGLHKDGKAPKGKTFVSRTIPIGTKVTKFSSEKATVSVWCTALIGMAGTGSKDPVRADWKTWTFRLDWTNGDWKVVKTDQKDGPAPVQGDIPASGSEEISKAVKGFGGFTYAR